MDKNIFPNYAQYHEDIILGALLYETRKGFYIDIGANHEEYHSVTKYFYKKGWTGISVDPISRFSAEYKKARPKDVIVTKAIADKKGKLEFREYPEHDGYSTLSAGTKSEEDKTGLPYTDYEVETITLLDLFKEYDVTKIDFLKIDVEGYEKYVLSGNDWKIYRPTVVCIEANHSEDNILGYLKSKSYFRFISDGLNDYYIADESKEIIRGFAERAALLSHYAVRSHHYKSWKENISQLVEANKLIEKRNQEINDLKENVRIVDELYSFKDKTLRRRLRLALKSLTKDYIEYRKGKS